MVQDSDPDLKTSVFPGGRHSPGPQSQQTVGRQAGFVLVLSPDLSAPGSRSQHRAAAVIGQLGDGSCVRTRRVFWRGLLVWGGGLVLGGSRGEGEALMGGGTLAS